MELLVTLLPKLTEFTKYALPFELADEILLAILTLISNNNEENKDVLMSMDFIEFSCKLLKRNYALNQNQYDRFSDFQLSKLKY